MAFEFYGPRDINSPCIPAREFLSLFSFAFISKMSYKPVIKKRRSDTPKAKNQQRCRRRTGLFKKAYEYGVECDADVCVVLRIRKNGQIFTFNSDSSGHWPPPQQELVCPNFTISRELGYRLHY